MDGTLERADTDTTAPVVTPPRWHLNSGTNWALYISYTSRLFRQVIHERPKVDNAGGSSSGTRDERMDYRWK